MKPLQKVLFLSLIPGMIFAVTYASMYVGGPGKSKAEKPASPSAAGLLNLSFPMRQFPARDVEPDGTNRDVTEAPTTEYGATGEHDFWFHNDNDEEVRVGLRSGCTCSEVQLFLAPDEWEPTLRAAFAKDLSDRRDRDALAGLAARAESPRALSTDNKEGVPVPARAFGFVRLRWMARRGTDGHTAEGKRLRAELWLQDVRLGAAPALEVTALFSDAVRLDMREINFGTLGSGDTAQTVVRCWSSTRPDLDVEVTSSGEPFVACVRTDPLTEEDRSELADRGGKVLGGWRLTIAAREQVGERRFDEGHFRHRLSVRPTSKPVPGETPEILVLGTVRGDVTVGGTGSIALGNFLVGHGTSKSIRLSASRPDLTLAVEEMPQSFLKATLSEPTRGVGTERTWLLTVKVEPNGVSGTFPRPDAEIYRDSAVYLKVGGAAPRRLRIPVSGTARQ